MLNRSLSQGVYVVESYLRNQFTLLTIYASEPSVQSGRFPNLPDWLRIPETEGLNPKRLNIIDHQGRALSRREVGSTPRTANISGGHGPVKRMLLRGPSSAGPTSCPSL
jgi:hypothetical protein